MNAEDDSSSERSHDGTYSHDVHLSPDIIIYSILTKIPPKDLHRFRCVCKPWSKLINDPLFASLYSKHATRTSSPRGFISIEHDCFVDLVEDETYNFVFFDIDNKEEKLIPFRLPKKGNFGVPGGLSMYIYHSFNGMLLISFHVPVVGDYESTLFVYNLVTASWLYIGTRPERLQDSSDAFLAYDPIISKYKVVVFLYRDRKFYILSDLLWSYVSMPEHLKDFTIDTFCEPVYVNYDLHWICEKLPWVPSNNKSKEDYGKLLRLNLSTGKVYTLKLPTMDSYCSPKHRGLLEMGGLLWFFHSASDYHDVKLWYSKKKNSNCGYEDDEWVMMYNIKLMTEISVQQLQGSTSANAKSQSSPVLLKYPHWTSCPILFVMDPKCKVVFTYLCGEDKHTNVCSYDTEFNQGSLIYARETNQKVLYWDGNNTALSTP